MKLKNVNTHVLDQLKLGRYSANGFNTPYGYQYSLTKNYREIFDFHSYQRATIFSNPLWTILTEENGLVYAPN